MFKQKNKEFRYSILMKPYNYNIYLIKSKF